MTEQRGRLVRVDEWAAFGGYPARFPLSFSVVRVDGVQTMWATAAGVSELVDLLAVHAQEFAVVLNVGTNSWLDDDGQWPLGRIAREQGVDAEVHDIRWAASRSLSDDLLVMRWRDMPRFFEGWSAYDIEVFDAAGPLSVAGADELALAVNVHNMKTPMLPLLTGARLYYSGHDDRFLYLETTVPTVVQHVLTRLLALQAGSALLEEPAESVTVAEPPAELVAELLRRSDYWVGNVAHRAAGELSIELATTDEPWRPSDSLPDAMPHRLTLDLTQQSWSMLW